MCECSKLMSELIDILLESGTSDKCTADEHHDHDLFDDYDKGRMKALLDKIANVEEVVNGKSDSKPIGLLSGEGE